MNCPNCTTQLVLAERQDIEIDYCPTCRGVWLDRGELDKIIERVGRSDISRRPEGRTFEDYDYDRYKSHRKKRGGFIGELFDF